MSETIFLTNYWLAPILWGILIIINHLLGNRIANLHDRNKETQNKIGFIFVLRILLAFPAMIYLWWFLTRLFSLEEAYLLFAGYSLLLWISAIIRQLSSLFVQFLSHFFKYDIQFSKDDLRRITDMQHIVSVADYFGYFLIYLLMVILTQSWFVAGGAVACLFTIGKRFLNAQKMIKAQRNKLN